MFDIKKDIQAMTTFRRNPANFPTLEGSFQKIRNFAICFLALSQTPTASSTPSTNATLLLNVLHIRNGARTPLPTK